MHNAECKENAQRTLQCAAWFQLAGDLQDSAIIDCETRLFKNLTTPTNEQT